MASPSSSTRSSSTAAGSTVSRGSFSTFAEDGGQAVTNEADYRKPDATEEREEQELESPDGLAVKGLGQFQRFKQVSSFRRLIGDWHVS